MKIHARLASLFVWSMCGLSILLAALGWGLYLLSGHVPDEAHGDHGMTPVIALAFVVLATIGALVVSRRTDNAVGWLMWALAVTTLVGSNGIGYGYVQYALEGPARPLPGAAWVAWLTNWVNFIGFVGFGVLFVIFPTGRAASRAWRVVLRGGILAAILVGFEEALRPGPLTYFPALDNPLGLSLPSPLATAAQSASSVLVSIALVAGAVSVLARFRGARAVERQQLKWVAYAVALVAGYFLFMNVAAALWSMPPEGFASRGIGIGWALAVSSMPLALGVAVLRYHLYAIDRIINRTLVYGGLSVVLALAYWGCVVILQQVLRPITAGSDLAIVGSTLVVAAVFQPMRGRIQAGVDRRFYRQHYDAARTLEAFNSRLRDEVDLDALGAELVNVVRRTMQPVAASLWLKTQSRTDTR